MRCFRLLLVLIAVLQLQPAAHAQDIDRLSFRQTDSLVFAMGPMRDSSLKSIIRSITPYCTDQVCQIRAIYIWVAKHISYDCAAAKNPRKANNSASYVLRTRSATSKGFGGLIAEMCRIAGITCEVADGVIKSAPDDIGHVDNEKNAFSWNVVKVAGRWFVLNAARGAGYCTGRSFTPELTDAWFLTARKLFVLCHYPKAKRWQLLDTPVERSAFVAAPVIWPVASVIGLFPAPGQRGLLRGRQDSSVRISLVLKAGEIVLKTKIDVDGVITEVPFSRAGDELTVTVPLTKSGRYDVSLLINSVSLMTNKPALTFRAEVSPRSKRLAGK